MKVQEFRRRTVLLCGALALAAAAAGCGGDGAVNSVTYPGVDAHGGFFLLAGTPHDPAKAGATVTCSGCHRPEVGAADLGSFTQYSCVATCHAPTATNAIHAVGTSAAVPGFAYASATCYGCHKDGLGISTVDHAAFFPIGTASHPAVCTNCHGTITSAADRKDLAKLQCATCHAGRPTFATKHAAVADYAAGATAADCLRCHADGQVATVASHLKFPIKAASPSHGTTCLQCHGALRTDKPWGAQWKTYACATTCHAPAGSAAVVGHPQTVCDPAHAGMTGYAYATTACHTCHPDGTGGAPANHPSLFPIGTGSAHAGVTCSQCHTSPNRQDVNALGCAASACHVAATSLAARHGTIGGAAILVVHTGKNTTGPPLTLTPANCVRCHADSQTDRVASHNRGDSGFGGDGAGSHRGAGCVTCHDVKRTDKAWATNWKVVNGGRAGRCSVCH